MSKDYFVKNFLNIFYTICTLFYFIFYLVNPYLTPISVYNIKLRFISN